MKMNNNDSDRYNLRSGITLYPAHQQQIDDILQSVMVKTPGHFALLTDVTGQVISAKGQTADKNLVALGSLIAGDLASSHEIARLTGEYQDYQIVMREGQGKHLFMLEAGPYFALLVQIGHEVPMGWAKMLILQAAEKLAKVMDIELDETPSLFDDESEDLSGMFDDALDDIWLEWTMFINWQLRELNLKIVYYGPALSGKTTNLEQIHARVNPSRRSELVSLKTNEDRTLYFDFLQLELGKISGLKPKIQLYTVPGQSYYEASRKLVLRGADGVVFVADSAENRVEADLRAWRDMKAHLISLRINPKTTPIVVQFNKQDLPNAVDPEVLKRVMRLNGEPTFSAVAIQNKGVFETLKTITNAVVRQVQRQVA